MTGVRRGKGDSLRELWVRQLLTFEEEEMWHGNEYGYCVNASVTLQELVSRTRNKPNHVVCVK